jgi:Flp pilus assembly protein CpaB
MTQFNSNSTPTQADNANKPAGNTALILVALSLALVAVLANIYYLQMKAKQHETENFTIYRVTRTIEPGEKIREKDLKEESLPMTVKDSFDNAVGPQTINNYLDTPVSNRIEQNGYVTFDAFSTQSGSRDMAIRTGYRAIAIPVNKETAPNALTAGAYIDITAMVRRQGQRVQPMLVMEKVRVVQVGTRPPAESEEARGRFSSYSTVTVEVKPEEDLALKALRRYMDEYEFDIRMRNPSDDQLQIKLGGVSSEVMALINSD